MKQVLVFLFSALLLTGCGGNSEPAKTTSSKNDEVQTEKTNEPTQEELNEKLKNESVEANFVELNSDNAEKGLKVHLTGELSAVKEEGIFKTFTITTNESDGYGMFSVVDVLKEVDYAEGDIVTVYGTFDGKNDLGMPKINATIIEK